MKENNTKMFKEIFLMSLIFLGSLVCFLFLKIVNVEATSYTFTVSEFEKPLLSKDDYAFTDKMNELIGEIRKTGKEYAITMFFDSSTHKFTNNFSIYLFDKKPLVEKFLFGPNVRYKFIGNEIDVYFMPDIYNLTENTLNSLITKAGNINSYQKYSGSYETTISFFQSNVITYASSFDITNASDSDIYNVYNTEIKKDDKFPMLKDKLFPSYSETYRFNTKGVSRIEYTFDVPNNLTLLPDLNYSYIWDYEKASLEKMNVPYLMWEKDGVTSIFKLENGVITEEGTVGYADTVSRVFTSPISNLKLIFDVSGMSDIDNSAIFIHFDSPFLFERQALNSEGKPVTPEKPPTSIDDINSSITDSTPPDTSGLGGAVGWLPPGPVDSILNLPLSFFNSLNSNLTKACKPVTLPLPFVNKNITLPCINAIYSEIDGLSPWINTIGLIASAFILYTYLCKLYQWVDDQLSLREKTWNDMDQWGGI